ncbi:hypothetical protein [Coxiella-like endosymbiont]|nr:hypothetical protein [Coxiella-like endosymbiont]
MLFVHIDLSEDTRIIEHYIIGNDLEGIYISRIPDVNTDKFPNL